MSTSSVEQLVPVRALTHGPKHHWFGYYDKLEFDPNGRYVLGMEVDFEHRSPTADDSVRVGMVDLCDNDRWIELGASRAWNWQQGCMLQWLPGSRSEVIWNDRSAQGFCCHILDIESGRERSLPAPIYTLSPDGRWGLAPDFRRIQDTRPGYGYAGLSDPYGDVAAPGETGIWRMDLQSGQSERLFSFADILRIPHAGSDWTGAKHWFNHLLFAPDGQRFVFLHRWSRAGPSFATRMLTADVDGSNLWVVDPYENTSHFIWRDPQHILAWAWHPSYGERFYLYTDRSEVVEVVAPEVMTCNGHCTYLPGGHWILNDTYPDERREQTVYLYDLLAQRRIDIGHFAAPPAYIGEWRCDTHPRCSPDGRRVAIDSAHGGQGRQLYLLEIEALVE